MQKKQRRKYIAQPETNDERIDSEDTRQFRVVSHPPKSDLENSCENIRNNADLTELKSINFENLGREEKNLI